MAFMYGSLRPLNKYAEELEEAFKEARTAYQKAESNLSDAEELRRKAEYFEEKFIGEKAAKIAYADAIMAEHLRHCGHAYRTAPQSR